MSNTASQQERNAAAGRAREYPKDNLKRKKRREREIAETIANGFSLSVVTYVRSRLGCVRYVALRFCALILRIRARFAPRSVQGVPLAANSNVVLNLSFSSLSISLYFVTESQRGSLIAFEIVFSSLLLLPRSEDILRVTFTSLVVAFVPLSYVLLSISFNPAIVIHSQYLYSLPSDFKNALDCVG